MRYRTLGRTGNEVTLDDETPERIDAVVAPGTEAGPVSAAYDPPAVLDTTLRRRPTAERNVA